MNCADCDQPTTSGERCDECTIRRVALDTEATSYAFAQVSRDGERTREMMASRPAEFAILVAMLADAFIAGRTSCSCDGCSDARPEVH